MTGVSGTVQNGNEGRFEKREAYVLLLLPCCSFRRACLIYGVFSCFPFLRVFSSVLPVVLLLSPVFIMLFLMPSGNSDGGPV